MPKISSWSGSHVSRSDFVFCVFAAVFAFVVSMIVGPLYIYGDQLHYRDLYENISTFAFFDAFDYYSRRIDSREYVHFIFVYFLSPFLQKDFFVAISNAVLVFLITYFFSEIRVSKIVSAFFVCTNFYLYVLFFSAERLKFSYIFFLLSLVFSKNTRLFCVFSLMSVLAHIQSIISYVAMGFSSVSKFFYGSFHRVFIVLSAIAVLVFGVIWFLLPQIVAKMLYFDLRDPAELVRFLVFSSGGVFYSKNRRSAFLAFFPLMLATLFLGGMRVNMISYTFFLYYALQCRAGFNFGVLITSFYFSYQGYEFVRNIYIHGTGFVFD